MNILLFRGPVSSYVIAVSLEVEISIQPQLETIVEIPLYFVGAVKVPDAGICSLC